MPDEITIEPKSKSPTDASLTDHNVITGRAQLVNIFAAGMAISFFLPWSSIWGANLSGFDLQKMGDEQRLLWLIPVLSIITILAGITKRSQKIVGQLTGLLPFLVGTYWHTKIGNDMPHVLAIGAYLSLICGAALFVLPRKTK